MATEVPRIPPPSPRAVATAVQKAVVAANTPGFSMSNFFSAYKRQPNNGTVSHFKTVRPRIEELCGRMYGPEIVGQIKFGEIKNTSYVVIYLLGEPAGAEGPASDDIFELNARFWEVLKDAGEGITENYEIQMAHRISGRMLIAPLAEQKKFHGR